VEIAVVISGVNDPPRITVPATVVVDNDDGEMLEVMSSGMKIVDVDEVHGVDVVDVSLAVVPADGGTISLLDGANLDVDWVEGGGGEGGAWTAVRFRATSIDCNKALNRILFKSNSQSGR